MFLPKQFHQYMNCHWPRKHTENHGKINSLTENGSVSFGVIPCVSVAGFLSKCPSALGDPFTAYSGCLRNRASNSR